MRYISLFSGIEAASVAWAPLGWEPIAFSEIEPFPCAVLEQRFPNVPNLGDITKVKWKEVTDAYGRVDLIVGGSPCQSFSIAGNRSGLAGASGLMFEYIRAVREVKPPWVVWENVPGALSVERGHAFAQLLDSLGECGYEYAWRVLDAQFFGVAQRRKRVFVVASLRGGGAPAEILFEPESLRRDHPSDAEKRATLTAGVQSGAGISAAKRAIGVHGDGQLALNANGMGLCEELSYTQTAVDRHSVLCLADDTQNAAFDTELTGTLKRGGGVPTVILRGATSQAHCAPATARASGRSMWAKGR